MESDEALFFFKNEIRELQVGNASVLVCIAVVNDHLNVNVGQVLVLEYLNEVANLNMLVAFLLLSG